MHEKKVSISGAALGDAEKVLVMLHGRGASAQDILSLTPYLNVKGYTIMAPQATNNTWYPYSFLSPIAANEPWLSSGLDMLGDVVNDITVKGVSAENIYFLGFSQGACLTLEFTARNAMKYGGIVAFTGGLIGDKVYVEHYSGSFDGTPVFIGTSDPDPHVPVERVSASATIFKEMKAAVTVNIYKNLGHTISEEEIRLANHLVFK